jgi:hypothetical protein
MLAGPLPRPFPVVVLERIYLPTTTTTTTTTTITTDYIATSIYASTNSGFSCKIYHPYTSNVRTCSYGFNKMSTVNSSSRINPSCKKYFISFQVQG